MSLQLWMPLTGDLRNQGLSGVTPTQTSGYTQINSGKLGKCYKFTTNFDTLLPLSKWDWTTGSVSFGAWLKISKTELTTLVNAQTYDSTNQTAGGTLLGRNSYGGFALRWKTNSIYTDGSLNNVYIYAHLRNTSSSINTTSMYTIPFDTWFHVMLVLDRTNSKINMYINGTLFTSSNLTVTGTFNTGTFLISQASWDGGKGRSISGCWQFNDIRVYNDALSEGEVKELSRGLVLHYPLNRNGWGQENLITNSKLDGSWTYPSNSYSDKYSPITTIVPSATQYTLSFDAKSTVNGDKMRTHYYSPNTTTTCVSSQGITKTATDGNMDFTLTTQWERYWVIYTQTETTAVKHLICPQLVSGQGTGTVSVKNVKFEEGSIATPWCPNPSDALATTIGLNSTTEYDISGFQNNGTKTGTFAYTSDTPKYDVSTNFPATGNNYINIGTQLYTMRDEMTVSIWAKPDDWASTSKSGAFSSVQSGGFGWQASSANYVFYCGTGESSNTYISSTVSVSGLSAGWHMLSATYDGLALRVYTDGVLTNTVTKYTTKTPLYYNSNSGMFVSGESAGSVTAPSGSIFRGSLSDLRIYGTALSAEDIAQLYSENKLS